MKTQLKADLALLFITWTWGISYLLVDWSLNEIGPLTLNAYRFLIAFFVIAIPFYKKMRGISKTTLKYGVIIGIALTLTYFGATFGVMYTSLSNAGFLCALSVVFTPILGFLVKGHKLSKKFWIGVFICTIGLGLLTLNETFKPAFGDILCIMCAFFYAVDLNITETACSKENVDVFQMAVIELFIVGAANLLLAFVFEKPAIPTQPVTIYSTLFLAVFCSGISIVVQSSAQRYTSASHVGMIFSLEPVFAAIVAYYFAGEVLTRNGYIGATLMVLSIFMVEIDFGELLGLKSKKA